MSAVIKEVRWIEIFATVALPFGSMYRSAFLWTSLFHSSAGGGVKRRTQRHQSWTWLPLPPGPEPSLSACVSPHHSLFFCSPSLSHPIPDIFPPLSYVCKRSHGNCRTACLATGFILFFGKKWGNRIRNRGGWRCFFFFLMSVNMWMVVKQKLVEVESLNLTRLFSPLHTCSRSYTCALQPLGVHTDFLISQDLLSWHFAPFICWIKRKINWT